MNRESFVMPSDDYKEEVSACWTSDVVKAAFEKFEDFKPEIVEEWKRIARIYAPSGQEGQRAEYIAGRFRELGIDNAHVDGTGNAFAMIDRGEGPTLAFIGTMDDLATVADMVKAWGRPIEEREGRLVGPGTNSSATCASLLGLARLFTLASVRFSGKIYLVGVVQEETGLTGVKGFIEDHPEIDYLVEVSGGLGRISYVALGIHWFKVHFRGPRAHTLRGPGPNVTKGVARSVTGVFSIPLQENTFLNVSMLGAGKVYNHRSDDGWHSVDLRSIDNGVLEGIKEEIHSIAEEVAGDEGLEWWIEPYSESPAGQLPGARDSRLVRVAEEATRLMGVEPTLSERGSSNMNAGIAAGIPSISAGGDRGGGRDTTEEYANVEPVLAGVKLHFLIGYVLLSGAKVRPQS